MACLFAAPVWLCDPLPIQDLPLHEQIVQVLVEGPAWTGFGAHLQLDPTPRPYAMAYFLWAALAGVVGVSVASRLLLTWAIVAWLTAGAALVRACRPELRARAWLVGLYLFHEFYYMGVVPFLVGLPLGLWLVRRWVLRHQADAKADPRALLTDGLLLLATYLLHPGSGLVTGLSLLPWVVGSPRRRRRAVELLATGGPSLLWTVGLLLFAPPYHHHYPVLPLSWNSPTGAALGLLSMPVSAYGSVFFWRAGGVTAWLGWLSVAAWCCGLAAFAWGRGQAEPAGRALPRRLLLASLGLALAYYLAFPYAWKVGSMLNFRALPWIFLWGLCLLPARPEGPGARVCVALAVLLTAAAAWLGHWQGSRELRPLAPILAAMEPQQAVIPPGVRGRSRVLRGAKLRLIEHAASRYHVRRGGLGSTGLIHFSISPVVVTDRLPDPRDEPERYRYFVSLDGEGPPPGFVRVPLRGTGRWALYERSSRAAQGR